MAGSGERPCARRAAAGGGRGGSASSREREWAARGAYNTEETWSNDILQRRCHETGCWRRLGGAGRGGGASLRAAAGASGRSRRMSAEPISREKKWAATFAPRHHPRRRQWQRHQRRRSSGGISSAHIASKDSSSGNSNSRSGSSGSSGGGSGGRSRRQQAAAGGQQAEACRSAMKGSIATPAGGKRPRLRMCAHRLATCRDCDHTQASAWKALPHQVLPAPPPPRVRWARQWTSARSEVSMGWRQASACGSWPALQVQQT